MIPVERVIGDTEPIISILICSINERAGMLSSLLTNLEEQIKRMDDCFSNAEVWVSLDEKGQHTTGAKRNALVQAALGKYICFIDDDDEVSDNYVIEIVKACEGNPDAVSINGTMTEDGILRTWNISRHNRDYTGRKDGRVHYWRHTNHLAPVRRSIALQCPFPNVSWEEDSAYSKALMNSRLLRVESVIMEPLYHYKYKKVK